MHRGDGWMDGCITPGSQGKAQVDILFFMSIDAAKKILNPEHLTCAYLTAVVQCWPEGVRDVPCVCCHLQRVVQRPRALRPHRRIQHCLGHACVKESSTHTSGTGLTSMEVYSHGVKASNPSTQMQCAFTETRGSPNSIYQAIAQLCDVCRRYCRAPCIHTRHPVVPPLKHAHHPQHVHHSFQLRQPTPDELCECRLCHNTAAHL
jgi:hypothetical protein